MTKKNPTNSSEHLICVDWGSSNFRAYLINKKGNLLEKCQSERGMLNCNGQFAETLEDVCAIWFNRFPDTPVFLSGMVGSREGWVDAGYMDTPLSLNSLVDQLVEIPRQKRRTWIVPGVRHYDRDGLSADIMRGEETQILGVMDQHKISDAIFVLPGTHSKWVQIDNGSLEEFKTYMTGELYSIIKNHSILRHSLDNNPPTLNNTFYKGVDSAKHGASLLNQLFGVRASDVLGLIPKKGQSSHLSGILIGQEITHALNHFNDKPIYIIGNDHLATLYQGALQQLERNVQVISGDIASRTGLYFIATQKVQK